MSYFMVDFVNDFNKQVDNLFVESGYVEIVNGERTITFKGFVFLFYLIALKTKLEKEERSDV